MDVQSVGEDLLVDEVHRCVGHAELVAVVLVRMFRMSVLLG